MILASIIHRIQLKIDTNSYHLIYCTENVGINLSRIYDAGVHQDCIGYLC